jgi:hypothetical protein
MGKYIRFLISRFRDLEISFEFSITNRSQISKFQNQKLQDLPLNVDTYNLIIWLDRDRAAGSQLNQTRHYR